MAAISTTIKAGFFIKKHWKKIIPALIGFLMIPLVIASSFTVTKAVPAVNDSNIRIYIDTAESVGKDKTKIDWKDLIAIDAVRYKQDFSKANSSNVSSLANRFIKENKEVTKYDFSKYVNIVSEVNSKYSINIDWRYVVMADSILKNQDFSNQNETSIRNLVSKFYSVNKTPEEYQELEKYDVVEEYQEWEPWFPLFPFLGGHYVTKTRTVTKERYVTKIRYKDGVSVKKLEDVLIDLGHSTKDIPEFFNDVNKIQVNMEKVKITYSTKTLDQVMAEMGFSEEEKRDIKTYRDVGLNLLFSEDGYTGSGYLVGGNNNPITVSHSEFINKVSKPAIDGYKQYGVFPSITIAQAILESGWGGSGLTAKANNLFGIKAYNWNGPYVEMPTYEYYGGLRQQVIAKFRVYNSWDDSVLDHGKFLKVNSTYTEHGVFNAKDYIAQAFAIKAAGYATDPNYPVYLINLIEQYNLSSYDEQAKR